MRQCTVYKHWYIRVSVCVDTNIIIHIWTHPSFESSTSQNCRQTKVEVHQPAVAATVTSRAAEVFKSAWNILFGIFWNPKPSPCLLQRMLFLFKSSSFFADDVFPCNIILFAWGCFFCRFCLSFQIIIVVFADFLHSNHHRVFPQTVYCRGSQFFLKRCPPLCYWPCPPLWVCGFICLPSFVSLHVSP